MLLMVAASIQQLSSLEANCLVCLEPSDVYFGGILLLLLHVGTHSQVFHAIFSCKTCVNMRVESRVGLSCCWAKEGRLNSSTLRRVLWHLVYELLGSNSVMVNNICEPSLR